ncbi:MAG: hypothetical protein K6A97_02170 [Lachnospiraceae bacterium]|nr:hypothetical protein [Lachnospiraceae bacterium]
MTKKRMILVLGIILSFFLIINLIWFGAIGYPYYRYEKEMTRCDIEGSLIKYIYDDEHYIYEIKPPVYLGFSSGFLRVSQIRDTSYYVDKDIEGSRVYFLNEDGNRVYVDDYRQMEFYYWEKPFGNSEYGIMYWSKDLDAQILFDKEFRVINGEASGYKEEFQRIIDKEKRQISEMMERAADIWKLEY